MATIIPLVAGIVSTTNEVIITRLLELGSRLHITRQNKAEMEKLVTLYKKFAEGINQYKPAVEAALSSEDFLSVLDKVEMERIFESLNDIVIDAQQNLIVLESRLNQDRNITGTAFVSTTNDDNDSNKKNKFKEMLSGFLKSKNNIIGASSITHAHRDQDTIKQLNDGIEKAETKLKEVSSLIESKFGIFRTHFKDYHRGDNIYLDYAYEKQDDSSDEAKLKQALMYPTTTGNSRQHDSVPSMICVQGQGGTGKTTILKDICTQDDVRKTFHDGIHFLTIGECAGDEQVMKEICRCVRNAGFGTLGAKIKDEENVEDAAVKVSKLFRGRKMLIVVDDWHPSHVKYLKHFQTILCESKNGVLLVSSRYRCISSRCDGVLLFKELVSMGLESKKILLKQIGDESMHENIDNGTQKAIDKILNVCGGVKLCLAVAGSSIRIRGDTSRIKRYAEDLERNSEEVVITKGVDCTRKFQSILETSLRYCNEELHLLRCRDIKEKRLGIFEARFLFKVFCVFEKQKQIPIEAIARLWDIDVNDALYVVRQLSFHSIVNMAENEKSVRVHDKVMDVARYLAEEDGTQRLQEWHEKILRGYIPLLCKSNHEAGEHRKRLYEIENESKDKDQEICWEVFSCPRQWNLGEEEEYFVGNLCRHLEESEKVEEIWKLLTNVLWTLMRRKNGGLIGLASDFKRMKRLFDKMEARCSETRRMEELFDPEERAGVELLMNHIRDGWTEIKSDEHMIGFEMFGRISKSERVSQAVMRFLKSIEDEGPRPWLRPLNAGLSRMDGRQISEIVVPKDIDSGSCISSDCQVVIRQTESGFEVVFVETQERDWFSFGENEKLKCTSICSRPLRVACGFESGIVAVCDIVKCDQKWKTFTGHDAWIKSISISKDGNRVVSGGCDGSVRVWDVLSGEQVGISFIGHNNWVRCIAMSEDGNRVVSGGDDETIRMWDIEGGKQVRAFTGHSGWIGCVQMSKDGNRIFSGGYDGTVRVWDVGKTKDVGEVVVQQNGRISCLGLSGDYTRLVIGDQDGIVQVWDLEEGKQLGEALIGRGKAIRCVGINEDGSRVLSVGLDRTVKMWDLNRCVQADDVLPCHDGPVQCLGVSGDGTHVVSGGRDGSVRVFEIESGEQIAEIPNLHLWWVHCVEMNEDGSRIVTGGDDKIIRIWDLTSRAQVGQTLVGHNGWVQCVAMSGDGKRIISGGWDNTVRVWDIKNAQIGEAFSGHDDWVICGVMTSDGTRAVSGGDDGTVRVWDVEKGEQIGPAFVGHHGRVGCVGFTKDGLRVVSCGRDRTVRLWNVSTHLQIGESFKLDECMSRSQVEYKEWLGIIRSSVVIQDEGSESLICMKSLHEDICTIIERIGISLSNIPIYCDCSECEREPRNEKCVGESEALIMWVKMDKGIYLNTQEPVKVGRVENVWCVKNCHTVTVGFRNGRVMICHLQL